MSSGNGKRRRLALAERCGLFRDWLEQHTKFRILGKPQNPQYDSTRIAISTNGTDIGGYELYERLEHGYGIVCEMADLRNVVLIPSICNTNSDFERLKAALKEIDAASHRKKERGHDGVLPGCPEFSMSLRTAFYFPRKKTIKTEEALNAISAQIHTVYPPGIPLLLPGQRITEQAQKALLNQNFKEVTVLNQMDEEKLWG
jgi:arginine/lysine/ornithine decarboxylase